MNRLIINTKVMHMRGALLKQFLAHREGVALIEFAIVFPVLFLLLFGGIEINRLILIQQKLEKAGYVIADIVTQYQPATLTAAAGEISVPEIRNNVFPQLARMMGTYSDPANQAAILTSLRIRGPAGGRTVTIDWQIGGGGTLSGCDGRGTCAVSIVNGRTPTGIDTGVRGTVAALPSTPPGNSIQDLVQGLPGQPDVNGYTLIVNEVFYFYQPLLGSLVEDVGLAGGNGFAGYRFYLRPQIYVKRTYFLPRLEGKLFDLPDPDNPANGFPVPVL